MAIAEKILMGSQKNPTVAPSSAKEGIRTGSVTLSIKVYSDWPTIPQLYVNGQFVGGSDIAMQMFESGDLAELVAAEG